MKEYHKIRWIYKFDEKTHLAIPVIDEYFENLVDCNWIFTEKIDWTNIRIVRDWHKPQFAGRTDNAQLPPKLLKRLQEIFMEELFEQKFWDTPVILYWEGYWGKIQKWINDYQDTEDFILFDVEINDIYLERESIEDIANAFNIKTVPILCEWSLMDGIYFVKWQVKSWNEVSKSTIEWLIGIPKGWFLDRLWKRIVVKIKQEHFRL